MLFGGYEAFKLENSLIGSVYPTAPGGGEDSDESKGIEGESIARQAMMKVVAERGKYFYGYTDYLVSSLLRTFCGCCCSKNSDSWYSRRV